MAPDDLEGGVPVAGYVVIRGGVVAHGLGQPALHLQPVVRLFHQFGHAVPGEELAGHPRLGRLEGQRLHAVLAELQLLGAVGVGKRATRALEAAGLVHRQQRARALADHALFQQHLGGRGGRAPAARRLVVGLVAGRFLRAHDPIPPYANRRGQLSTLRRPAPPRRDETDELRCDGSSAAGCSIRWPANEMEIASQRK